MAFESRVKVKILKICFLSCKANIVNVLMYASQISCTLIA